MTRPPARRARLIALGLSAVAVAFSIGFGFCLRRAIALNDRDTSLPWLVSALVLVLVALLLRMVAAICELLWLERTWSNLPEHMRNVGPMDNVSSGLVIGISFVPGIAWVWKLGVVVAIADALEATRAKFGHSASVPKKLGMAAVIVGWVPGLNVYVAPFLWEMFAKRIEIVCIEQQRGRG